MLRRRITSGSPWAAALQVTGSPNAKLPCAPKATSNEGTRWERGRPSIHFPCNYTKNASGGHKSFDHLLAAALGLALRWAPRCFGPAKHWPGCLCQDTASASQGDQDLAHMGSIWVRAKIKPPGYGPQVLVFGSIYQGKPFWGYPIFHNHTHFVWIPESWLQPKSVLLVPFWARIFDPWPFPRQAPHWAPAQTAAQVSAGPLKSLRTWGKRSSRKGPGRDLFGSTFKTPLRPLSFKAMCVSCL